MRYLKLFFSTIILFSFVNCKAQDMRIKDLSGNAELNYILSNLSGEGTFEKVLFKKGMYIRIYIMTDSKATPEGYFEGTDEVLQSLIISSLPDGDYYTASKLYKVEALLNPKVLDVSEENFPNFMVKIEYGEAEKRKIESFVFEGAK